MGIYSPSPLKPPPDSSMPLSRGGASRLKPVSAISGESNSGSGMSGGGASTSSGRSGRGVSRSEEHTSELQSRGQLVCRLLLEKKKHLQAPKRGRLLRPSDAPAAC